MRELMQEYEIVPTSILVVTILGATAWIYVCRFGGKSS